VLPAASDDPRRPAIKDAFRASLVAVCARQGRVLARGPERRGPDHQGASAKEEVRLDDQDGNGSWWTKKWEFCRRAAGRVGFKKRQKKRRFALFTLSFLGQWATQNARKLMGFEIEIANNTSCAFEVGLAAQ